MIIYISGIENSKKIENAIYELQMDHNIFVGEPIKNNSVDLLREVKSSLCKNKEISTIIIDLSVIINSDEEIIQAIKTLRFYNDQCKFIIIGLERSIGDTLLNNIVNMGIYNIITNEDELISKISEYSIQEASYKEASIYQIQEEEENKENIAKKFRAKTKVEKIKDTAKKENKKVILKPLKGKILVSIIGTQQRIGVTHTAINLAYNLMKAGYRVAVVELNGQDDFKYLAQCYDNTKQVINACNCLKISKIDFFCNTTKNQFALIQGLNYDYIIIDNGNISNCDLAEHNRCDVKLVRFGSLAWEQHYLADFMNVDEEIIQNYTFLTMCDESIQKDISEELSPYKVKFLNYKFDMFSENKSILQLIDGFLYEDTEKKKKSFLGLFSKK